MGGTTRRWTREEIVEFIGGAIAFARDEHAGIVPLPEWIPADPNPPPWDEQISWIHVADRGEMVAAWRNAIVQPGVPMSIRCRASRDGGATWHLSEARYLNLVDHEDVGAILVAHVDLGPTGAPVEQPAGPGYEAPTWIIQHLDPIGIVLRTEGDVDEVFGYRADELEGRNVLEHLHPDDHPVAIAMWLEVVAAPRETRTVRQRILRPDGSWVWLESTVMNQLEEIGAVVAISHDVSARHHQEAALRASEQEFRALAEGVPVAVFRAVGDGMVTYANGLWYELIAPYAPVTSVFKLAADPDAVRQRWPELVAAVNSAWEIDVETSDGRVLRLRCRSLPPVAGAPVVIGTLEDVSDELARADELLERAERDALTGLVNRAGFERIAAEALATTAEEVVLVFVDLDGFKVVNDTWGHVAGDGVLQAVADRLTSVVRPGDVVARYGGDEFVLLCSGVKPGEDAAIAARIEMALDPPIPVADSHWRQLASVGVVRPHAGEAALVALHRADEQMYRRKRGRRPKA